MLQLWACLKQVNADILRPCMPIAHSSSMQETLRLETACSHIMRHAAITKSSWLGSWCRIDEKTDGCQLDMIILSELVADEEVSH